jgi:dipeptide transport system ATP-binding protein
LNPPSGCAFHQRCEYAIARCADETPLLEDLHPLDPSSQVQVACLRARELND